MPGKFKIKRVLAELFLSVNCCNKLKRADLPKFVLNEGLIIEPIEQLLLGQSLCFLDFCTSLRICLEALFFATFLCKIGIAYNFAVWVNLKALYQLLPKIFGNRYNNPESFFRIFSIVSVTF